MINFSRLLKELNESVVYKKGDVIEVTSSFGSAKQYTGKQGKILSVSSDSKYVTVKIPRAKSPEIEFNVSEIKKIKK